MTGGCKFVGTSEHGLGHCGAGQGLALRRPDVIPFKGCRPATPAIGREGPRPSAAGVSVRSWPIAPMSPAHGSWPFRIKPVSSAVADTEGNPRGPSGVRSTDGTPDPSECEAREARPETRAMNVPSPLRSVTQSLYGRGMPDCWRCTPQLRNACGGSWTLHVPSHRCTPPAAQSTPRMPRCSRGDNGRLPACLPACPAMAHDVLPSPPSGGPRPVEKCGVQANGRLRGTEKMQKDTGATGGELQVFEMPLSAHQQTMTPTPAAVLSSPHRPAHIPVSGTKHPGDTIPPARPSPPNLNPSLGPRCTHGTSRTHPWGLSTPPRRHAHVDAKPPPPPPHKWKHCRTESESGPRYTAYPRGIPGTDL